MADLNHRYAEYVKSVERMLQARHDHLTVAILSLSAATTAEHVAWMLCPIDMLHHAWVCVIEEYVDAEQTMRDRSSIRIRRDTIKSIGFLRFGKAWGEICHG
jgi:hypothetical protein